MTGRISATATLTQPLFTGGVPTPRQHPPGRSRLIHQQPDWHRSWRVATSGACRVARLEPDDHRSGEHRLLGGRPRPKVGAGLFRRHPGRIYRRPALRRWISSSPSKAWWGPKSPWLRSAQHDALRGLRRPCPERYRPARGALHRRPTRISMIAAVSFKPRGSCGRGALGGAGGGRRQLSARPSPDADRAIFAPVSRSADPIHSPQARDPVGDHPAPATALPTAPIPKTTSPLHA